jgi:hypothetical protein
MHVSSVSYFPGYLLIYRPRAADFLRNSHVANNHVHVSQTVLKIKILPIRKISMLFISQFISKLYFSRKS